MPSSNDKSDGGMLSAALRFHSVRAFRYGLVSGAGLAIDFALFLALIRAGFGPFVANILSSATALTFVYLASVRRIFRYRGQFIAGLFAIFVVYHLCGTPLASWVITKLAQLGLAPALAKVGLLPLTFTANYLFMSWLTARRERICGRNGFS